MTRYLLALAILLQATPGVATGQVSPNAAPRRVAPVLAFPEAGMDDTAAYQGYATRLYRDSKRNTVQVYLEPRGTRVVQLWADALDESVGFTVRDGRGRPVGLAWSGDSATVADSDGARTIEYGLTAASPDVTLGWFLLGSMRVERDFQYARGQLRPFAAPPYVVTPESLLVANIARLPAAEQPRHLALLGAASVADLRSRLQPTITSLRSDTMTTVRIARPALDGQSHLVVALDVDPRQADARVNGRTVSIRARSGTSVHLAIRVATNGPPLTPLTRDDIFNAAFLAFLAHAKAAGDSTAGSSSGAAAVARYRRLEREVRSVELLSSDEKLMAGLPNFATYFGRDGLMTALMMPPVWSPVMAERVIASVLRKLGPAGDVSHEEALGEQAIRENADDYNALVSAYLQNSRSGHHARADSALTQARLVLRDLRTTRENYHMMDDEFQLPVLEALYLSDTTVPVDRKRAFLLANAGAANAAPRLALMLREMALVATETQPYARQPIATNLVGFVKRDSTHWRSASWRDSDAGYANGRFAMDINAIWAPRALQSIADLLSALHTIGFSAQALDSIAPEIARSPLAAWIADPASLRRATDTWQHARSHFIVAVGDPEMDQRIGAKLAWLPNAERRYWERTLSRDGPVRDSLVFLALSLDAGGHPIPVVNTDPATDLFLNDLTARVTNGTMTPNAVLQEIAPFMRPYPVGLFVNGLGPVVANDTYAARSVWDTFRQDPYHSPRVVWGREVNLFLLGVASQISSAYDGSGRLADPALEPYVLALHRALDRTLAAVNASGLEHNELWSYRIAGGRLLPTRYGTSSDVQLWSSTDLAVQFALSRLPRP